MERILPTKSASEAKPFGGKTILSRHLWTILAIALAALAASALLALLAPQLSEPLVLSLLAVLAVVGVFALFAWMVGIFTISGEIDTNSPAFYAADGLNDALIVMDASARIVYANPAYSRLIGADGPHDLRSIERAFVGNTEIADAIFRLSQAMKERRRWTELVRVESERLEGGPRWLRINVKPLQSSSTPSSDHTLWQLSDITRDRVHQEQIVRDLQQAIHYLDHAPVGFFSCEAGGKLRYINATLCNWLGHDIVDVPESQLTLDTLTNGNGVALIKNQDPAAGKTVTSSIDLDFIKHNGQRLPVRLVHQVPYATDGTLGESRSIVLNRELNPLEAEENPSDDGRFSRLFHSMPMAIATVDARGQVMEANAAFYAIMVGPSSNGASRQTKALSIFSLVNGSCSEQVNESLLGAMDKRADIPPLDVTLNGTQERSARLFFYPGDDYRSEAAVVYALDMTEQRVLEAQFAQSQKMQAIGQLAGGVAHDFNNVLTAIVGFSDLLLASRTPSDPAYQDLMNIKQNANRAAGLVRQLLAFSRRQTLLPQVLVLTDVLSDLNALLGRLIGEGVNLVTEFSQDLWYVKVDINQIEQVIINLAVNARDAMPDGGDLVIETRNINSKECASLNLPGMPVADYIMLEVRDTGVGMSDDVLKKVFEPFFSTKEVGKGTGLGLSTVYGIIKQTGGFVYPDSIPGQGTVFRILLPRYIPEVKEKTQLTQDSQDAVAPITDLTGNGRILLVEDEMAVRTFAERALVSRGYEVLSAETGREALTIMEKHGDSIDLIISDVVMPEMDGPTMLTEIRKINPDVNIIFVSGYAEEAFSRNLEKDMEFVFLPKPFTLKKLIRTVKTVLVSSARSHAC